MDYYLIAPSDPEDTPTDWLSERMRAVRNTPLAASDWTQVEDAPVDKAAWAAYRQQLRDAPASWTPGPTWEAPNPPNA